MRGKHGRAAQVRQEWSEIEQERDAAIRRADKATAELASARDAWARKQAAMEAEVAALRAAVSEAVTPVVQQLRESLERMRVERQNALDEAEKANAKQGRMAERTVEFLAEALGITKLEAMEYLVGFVGGVGETVVGEDGQILVQTAFRDDKLLDRLNRGELTYEQAVRIDNARYGRKRHVAYDEAFDAVINGYRPAEEGAK